MERRKSEVTVSLYDCRLWGANLWGSEAPGAILLLGPASGDILGRR
jgi:hypothetical protein